MKDFRIVTPYDILNFTNMTRQDNFLRFSGTEDYRNVVFVVVNDECLEDIAMLGPDLLAYIPETLDTSSIRYVALVAETNYASNATMLRFGLGPFPKEVSGADRLIQLFVKVLFQSPGSDIYHKTIGGGLLKVTKQGVSFGEISVVASEVAASVKKAERDVKRLQTGQKYPSDETLVQVKVLSIVPDQHTMDVQVMLGLSTLAGTRTFFNVAA